MRIKQIIKNHWDEFLGAYYHQECSGCSEGHSSFWRTVITSPQWQTWQQEQNKRMKTGRIVNGKFNKSIYDMPEVEELGIISQKHFQEFLKFIYQNKIK